MGKYKINGLFFLGGCLLAFILTFDWMSLSRPVPYTDVRLRSVERKGDWLYLYYDFNKRACVFKKIAVVGRGFDTSELLEWSNWYSKDATKKKTGDRIKGHQDWRLKIRVKPKTYDMVEIRTRHNCNGIIVDRVFATIKEKDDDKEKRQSRTKANSVAWAAM